MKRVWLTERTYSDDEQNLIILEYATPDGKQYLRQEKALTSFDDTSEIPASLEVNENRLGKVREEDVEENRKRVENTRREYGAGENIS